jgi:hypothetical protein
VEIHHPQGEDLDKPSPAYGGHSRNELAKIVAQRHQSALDAAAKRKTDPDWQPPATDRVDDRPNRPDRPDQPKPQEAKREYSEAELPEAMKRAQAEHKELVIRFTKESCPACHYMENSWQDQNVQNQIDRGAIVVNVNAAYASNLSRAMAISALPTTIVARPNEQGRLSQNDVVGRHVGALSGEGLRRFLSQSGVQ